MERTARLKSAWARAAMPNSLLYPFGYGRSAEHSAHSSWKEGRPSMPSKTKTHWSHRSDWTPIEREVTAPQLAWESARRRADALIPRPSHDTPANTVS